jgi:septum formation protein
MSALWLADRPLVLASKSAVRRSILESAGIPVEAITADIDERAIEKESAASTPAEVALLLARRKAAAVAEKMPGRLVVGADQTLALGTRRFTKPVDRSSARKQLLDLRGQTHALYSGVALVRDGALLHGECEVAKLTMRDFSDSFLDAYLDAAGQSVCESVGGYQLERLGIQCFERVDGDHNTILGLPVLGLLAALRKTGAVAG